MSRVPTYVYTANQTKVLTCMRMHVCRRLGPKPMQGRGTLRNIMGPPEKGVLFLDDVPIIRDYRTVGGEHARQFCFGKCVWRAMWRLCQSLPHVTSENHIPDVKVVGRGGVGLGVSTGNKKYTPRCRDFCMAVCTT